MANEYKKFADSFIEEFVHAEGYPEDGDMQRAKELATRCKLRAEKAGLNPTAFEFHLGVTLEEYMRDAIEAVNDAEVERLASKDD